MMEELLMKGWWKGMDSRWERDEEEDDDAVMKEG